MELIPDTDDALVGQFSIPVRAAADVVGIYSVDDPADDFWIDEWSLDLPTVIVVSPGAAAAVRHRDPFGRCVSDPDRQRPAGPVRVGLLHRSGSTRCRRTRRAHRRPAPDANPIPAVRHHAARRGGSRPCRRACPGSWTTTPASGEQAEAVLVTAFARSCCGGHRGGGARRPADGASPPSRASRWCVGAAHRSASCWGSHIVEGLLIAVPASAIAYAAAVTVVGGRASAWSAILAVVVASGAALVLTLTVLRPATASLRGGGTRGRIGGTSQPAPAHIRGTRHRAGRGRRLPAAGNGIAGGSTAGELAGVDPLLAAVPALIGLAVGLLTVRIYPLPLIGGRLARRWLAGNGAGVRPAPRGPHRRRRQPAAHRPAGDGRHRRLQLDHLRDGRAQARPWRPGRRCGADLTIAPGSRPFPSGFDGTTLPGVQAAARMHVDSAVARRPRRRARGNERARHTGLCRRDGRHRGRSQPAACPARPSGSRPADPGHRLHPGPRAVHVGSSSTMGRAAGLGGAPSPCASSGSGEMFPSLDPSEAWLVMPLETLRAAAGARAFTAAYLLRAPGTTAASVDLAMALVLPATQVTSRARARSAAASADRRALVSASSPPWSSHSPTRRRGAAALVLVAAVRGREVAHLRTLGHDPSWPAGLSIVEHGPTIVAASVVGVALGVGVDWFVAPDSVSRAWSARPSTSRS